MAKQVRPWLAKPVPDEAPRVRVSDRGANQQIPSGTAAKKPHLKSECTGAIFTFEPSLIESLANRGRPCTASHPILIHAEASMKVSTFFGGGHHADGIKGAKAPARR